MTKYYLNDIENVDAITNEFDNGDFNFNGEDENGYYWKNKRDFDWWAILAGALNFLEDGIDALGLEVNELEDYVELAKEYGFNPSESFGRVYANEIEGYEDINFGCDRDFKDAYRFDGKDSDGYFWYGNNENIVEKF